MHLFIYVRTSQSVAGIVRTRTHSQDGARFPETVLYRIIIIITIIIITSTTAITRFIYDSLDTSWL